MASQRRCRAFANAVLVLVVLTLSACAVPQFWWTYQNDLEHTGYVRGGMGRSPVLRWDVTPGGGASDLTPPVFGSIGDTFRLFIGTGYGDRTLYHRTRVRRSGNSSLPRTTDSWVRPSP
jgi:hypothetical protein